MKQILKLNSFYYYANEYRKNLTTEDEIEKIDMTEVFIKELEQHIKDEEIIIIQINGKTRLGKSTIGIHIAKNEIYPLLKKYKKQPQNTQFNIKNICRDQQEYSKQMRNPKLQNNILVTDEYNDLESTGENTTAEESLRKVYSNVQAGRYIHTISCSPKETIDPNTDIILNVYAIDKKTTTTICKLYYKFYEGGTEYIQLLGKVKIDVGETIKNWEKKAKKLFYKNNKTKKENEELEELRKQDMFVEYMIKKYEKMDLINKEGIFRPRILDYAEIITTVIEKLRNLTKIQGLINQTIIRNYIKIEMKKAKIVTSIIGEKLATDEVQGVLDLWKAKYRLEQDIKKNINKNKPTKELIDMNKEVINAIAIQMEEYRRYEEINKKYHEYSN